MDARVFPCVAARMEQCSSLSLPAFPLVLRNPPEQ